MGPSSSKTHFAGIITNLLTSDIAGDDYDFWDDLWKVSLTTEEIFELISVEGNKYYYYYYHWKMYLLYISIIFLHIPTL